MKVIKSPINYNGNKTKIIEKLIDLFPSKISVFVDLFGGSGVVSLNVEAEHYIYNDIVYHVKNILEGISSHDDIDLLVKDLEKIEKEFGLDAHNKENFENFRNIFNEKYFNSWEHLYILMCNSFNSQFRFNNKQQYNSSWGGDRCYFRPVVREKLIDAYNRFRKMDIIFTSHSFEDFDFSNFDKDDFVYLDPPYYGSIGNYNDGKRGFKGWNLELEEKMRELCENLDKQGIRFALSNNLAVNTTLEEWAIKNGFSITYMDLDYNNSNYQKKNKVKDIEVVIRNYK